VKDLRTGDQQSVARAATPQFIARRLNLEP